MRSFNDTQSAIVASAYKAVSWLFVITAGGTTYYWSTKAKTWAGQPYTFKVLPESFDGVILRRIMSEQGLVNAQLLEFDVSNPSNTLSPSDFIDQGVTLSLVVSDGTSEAVIRAWKFAVVRCENRFQKLHFYCEDFVQRYLRGDYPNTKLVRELSQSLDPEPEDTLCVPVPVGTCYVPLRSVYILADDRYYVLGPVDGGKTYTLSRVRSPRALGKKSEWTSAGGYSFTQATKTLDGESYRVFQPIVADADGDGVVESAGLWKQGNYYLDAPTQFSRSDTALLTSPEDVLEFVLEDFGVPSADIDTGAGGTFAAAGTTFAGWGLTWNGAFYLKEPRSRVLARLLNMCHATLRISDTIELSVLSKTSRKTLTTSEILSRVQGVGFESTFRYEPMFGQSDDSGYIAFQVADESQDATLRVLVPAKSSYAAISGEVLEIPFVQDSQAAQKLGTLYYQRRFLSLAKVSFDAKGTCLALDPDDVITIDGSDYGGTYDALIDSIHIHRDLRLSFECTRFSAALDDWGDLSPAAVSPAADTIEGAWEPVIAGPDSTLPGSAPPNQLPGRLTIGESGNYILLDPAVPILELIESAQVRVEIGDLGTDDYGFRLRDHAGNLIMVLDGAGASTIAGWDLTSSAIAKNNATLDSAGVITLGTGNNVVIASAVDASYRIWAGHATPASAPFSVTKAGGIQATSGTIGTWLLTTHGLADNASEDAARIFLDKSNTRIRVGTISSFLMLDGANVKVESSNYSSGAMGSGFTLRPDLLEVGNIACRGIFRTAVFEKLSVSAVGGNLLVRPADILEENPSTREMLYWTDTAGVAWTDTADLTWTDPLEHTITIKGTETFAVNDILRMKTAEDDEYLKVIQADEAPTYVVQRDLSGNYAAGAEPAWPEGTAVVNYGPASGAGMVYMTSSDTYAPFLSVVTHTGTPWSAMTTRVRVGNLNGFLGYSSDVYGIAIGQSDAYLKYDPTGGMQIKGSITITGGSGIAGLSDAGDLATADDLDDVPDGSTYYRTTSNQVTGAGRAYSALDTSARLVTAVLPGTSVATPAGSGLFLGSDYMGYYSGAAWQAYIRNNGTFAFKGNDTNYLVWDGSNLSIKGVLIVASGGNIPASNLADWAHASDATKIDGGDIYTGTVTATAIAANTITASQIAANTITANQIAANTITASQINGAGFGTLTISSGKIAINTTDALEIQSSGNVKVLNGGDIVMQSTTSNPSRILWSGSNYDIEWSLQGDSSLTGTGTECSFTVAPGAIYRAQFRILLTNDDTPGFFLIFNNDTTGTAYAWCLHSYGVDGGSEYHSVAVDLSDGAIYLISDGATVDYVMGEVQFSTTPGDDTDVLVRWHVMTWGDSNNYRDWYGSAHYGGGSDLSSVKFYSAGNITGKIFLERLL